VLFSSQFEIINEEQYALDDKVQPDDPLQQIRINDDKYAEDYSDQSHYGLGHRKPIRWRPFSTSLLIDFPQI